MDSLYYIWKVKSSTLHMHVAFQTHWTGIQGITKCEVIDNYCTLPILHVLGS